EADHHKSITIVELKEKGSVEITTQPLIPLHDMRILRGTYNEIVSRDNYERTNTEDYVQVILTDEEDVPDAISRLRVIYPNIMSLKYDNKRTRSNTHVGQAEDIESKTPVELFHEFYQKQNNQEMSQEQQAFITQLIEKIWEE
ncbi:MAG: exonuclease SbcCD subunit D C-terminal domain-containing protein, partial [Erysipelotrichales bacterium]|nr:exonuclease SbcCD subunit D C-terminal domain-containing protein [Erysipelotrichales bacterium]